MAVKLRLKKMGKKRQPVYKIVAADARSPRDGKIIESLGLYNPKTNPATVELNNERAQYWLAVGAQPTDTVKNILSRKGLLLRIELAKEGRPAEEIEKRVEEFLVKKGERIPQTAAAPVQPSAKVEDNKEASGAASEESRKEEE